MRSSAQHPLSRRDLLAAFLGIPFLAGCDSHSASVPPAGELVGAGIELGHALRDNRFQGAKPDTWQSSEVVIVGAGVAGLSAAWRFSRAGFHDYRLVELESVPGGTSRSGSSRAGKFPWGAHYLPVPQSDNRALFTLLTEMGVVSGIDDQGNPQIEEQTLCRDPQERVFFNGAWHEDLWFAEGLTAEDLRQFALFQAEVDRWTEWRDGAGRRAFAIPVDRGSDDADMVALDRQTMGDWLSERGITSSRVRWLVDYACRDDYGLTVDQTSAWAGLFYFASRVSAPGAHAQPLLTWPEGNGRLVAHLAAGAQDRIDSGWGVAEIRIAGTTEETSTSSPLEILAANSAGAVRGIRARQVVFCGPQFLAPHLIEGYRAARGELVREFHYGSWLVANLTLRDRPRESGFPLCWDNVIYDSPSLGYVVNSHQTGVDRGPTVFTWYYPNCAPEARAARITLEQLGWSDCAELALSDLERAHPDVRSLVERIDIMRWGHAMIQPKPRFVWGPARRACAAPYRGIHFAHSDNSGVALFEEAFYQGIRAAEEVLASRGISFQTLLK
ncbi:MAG: FAD-dependent oxidoreductase [Planctomycetota bacterium]|nr:FAD-dependent oxidoreductase [Planctomycetota bacterium]